MLSIKNLTLQYKNSNILDNISHDYKTGTSTAIIGNNGAGKTCLLQTVIGQIKPTAWHIHNNIWSISYCPDNISWYKYLTPYEHAQSINKNSKTIAIWIERLQLQKYQNTAYHKLSKGNKQKVNLLLSLLSKADMYIRDEPTQHLDPETRYIIHDIIYELKQQNKTIIYSTHFLEDIWEHTDGCMIIEQWKIQTIYDLSQDMEHITKHFKPNKT